MTSKVDDIALLRANMREQGILLTCPYCGEPMILRYGPFTYKDGKRRPFWGCTQYPHCKAAHGAHPDGKPLGKPANEVTKRARDRAHKVFDRLWKEGHMSRPEAYCRLQEIMGRPVHFGSATAETCAEAVKKLKEVYGTYYQRKSRKHSASQASFVFPERSDCDDRREERTGEE